jgi:hypothetical protein
MKKDINEHHKKSAVHFCAQVKCTFQTFDMINNGVLQSELSNDTADVSHI